MSISYDVYSYRMLKNSFQGEILISLDNSSTEKDKEYLNTLLEKFESNKSFMSSIIKKQAKQKYNVIVSNIRYELDKDFSKSLQNAEYYGVVYSFKIFVEY